MPTLTFKVKRKSSTEEWKVCCYVDGKYSEDKTYYTTDKQDAIDTCAYLIKVDAEQSKQ
jgi:hypothetical protein